MPDSLRIWQRPSLEAPVLITAFRGWNDGAQGATIAAGYLARSWKAGRFAEIDPEEFFDFQATRPLVSLTQGLTRRIDWPENSFHHARIPGLDRDAVLLLGIEPNLRWWTFSGLVVSLAQELGIELVVSLGALLADVPHSRPAPITGTASDPELIESLGLQASRYEGPTGIVGVLHDAFRRSGVQSVSLWAAVPHYVSLTPSPRAALALSRRLEALLGATFELGELEEAARGYEQQVSDAVLSDPDTLAYVEELERRADVLDDDLDVASGESLAAELTRFLREREENEDEEGPTGPAV